MKILLVDDHKIVREGLKEILKKIPWIKDIEEAGNGRDALRRTSEDKFELVILDISLPDISGIDVLDKLKSRSHDQKVLILSMHSQEQYALRALRLGASGYLTKDTAPEELVEAVNKISKGGKYISVSLAENIAAHFDTHTSKPLHEILSKREFEIMIKIAKGKSLKEIGGELFISDKTVSTYRSRIMEKMNMKKNAEITHYCIRNGLVI